MQEQRATPRVRSYLAGKVLFPNGISTMDCAVRDISSCGARLQVTSTAGLPGHFRLHIPQRERTYDVRLVWVGVPAQTVIWGVFVGRPVPHPCCLGSGYDLRPEE